MPLRFTSRASPTYVRLSIPMACRTSVTFPACTPAHERPVYEGTNWWIAVIDRRRSGAAGGDDGVRAGPEQRVVQQRQVGVDRLGARRMGGDLGEALGDGTVVQLRIGEAP